MTKKEKIIKKIKDLMTKWSVTNDELEEFGSDLENDLVDEDFVDDLEVEEKVEETTETPDQEEPVEAEVEEKVEETEEQPEPAIEETPTEEQPVEKSAPAGVTPEEISDIRVQIEGLNSKIDGLLDALTKAGVLEENHTETPIGMDESSAPANDSDVTSQSVLARLNRGR